MDMHFGTYEARRLATRLLPSNCNWFETKIDCSGSNGQILAHVIVLFKQQDGCMRVRSSTTHYIKEMVDFHLYCNYLLHLGEALRNILDPEEASSDV